MVNKSEFIQWRDHAITQELLKNLNELASQAASEILNGDTWNQERVLFLKGYLQCISQVVGYQPEMTNED